MGFTGYEGISQDNLKELKSRSPERFDKVASEFINLIRKEASLLRGASEVKFSALAARFVEKNLDINQVKQALEYIQNNYDFFPTYREIDHAIKRVAISQNKPIEKVKDNSEQIREDILEKAFVAKFGANKLTSYIKWYVEQMHLTTGLDFFKLDSVIFKRSALFDWDDARQTTDFNKVIDIAKTKMPNNS